MIYAKDKPTGKQEVSADNMAQIISNNAKYAR
jgi:hypothetical protein